jgi:cytochrome c-type biogenesis protein CcmH
VKAPVVLALGLLAACSGEEKAVPPPSADASAPAPGLRPLTSRDGAADAASVPSGSSLPPGHPPIGDAPKPGAASGPPIKGTISVGAQVAGRLVPNEVLFIVARSATSKQVLAVRKEEGARFPFAFEISGADAMVEGTSFTGPFDITARISRSGDAIPTSGDIEGFARGVATGASGVTITLDSVRQ